MGWSKLQVVRTVYRQIMYLYLVQYSVMLYCWLQRYHARIRTLGSSLVEIWQRSTRIPPHSERKDTDKQGYHPTLRDRTQTTKGYHPDLSWLATEVLTCPRCIDKRLPYNFIYLDRWQSFNLFKRNEILKRIIWASTRENLSSVVCEQHRRRPACASAQSDQRLCYSLFRKYHM